MRTSCANIMPVFGSLRGLYLDNASFKRICCLTLILHSNVSEWLRAAAPAVELVCRCWNSCFAPLHAATKSRGSRCGATGAAHHPHRHLPHLPRLPRCQPSRKHTHSRAPRKPSGRVGLYTFALLACIRSILQRELPLQLTLDNSLVLRALSAHSGEGPGTKNFNGAVEIMLREYRFVGNHDVGQGFPQTLT